MDKYLIDYIISCQVAGMVWMWVDVSIVAFSFELLNRNHAYIIFHLVTTKVSMDRVEGFSWASDLEHAHSNTWLIGWFTSSRRLCSSCHRFHSILLPSKPPAAPGVRLSVAPGRMPRKSLQLLHPALLDGALQLLVECASRGAAGTTFLFLGF